MISRNENSIKDTFLFKKIDWMIPEFDLKSLCERMDWKIDHETSQHIVTFCPDHHLYVGREPSHPKFYIDKKTGQTQCKTESRGSNLVWTVKRLLNCNAQDAYKFIVGTENIDDLSGISWKVLKKRIEETDTEDSEEDDENHSFLVDNFSEIKLEIFKGILHESGYNYFQYPIGKKPTLIEKDTVKHFKCFQRNFGYFKDRVFIPVYLQNSLTGFVAIDILGEKENERIYPEKKYKKLLYPKGFKSGKNLFNYDTIENGAESIIIVEGVRDAMKLWQMGYKNVVSCFGTNISQEQCVLISRKYPDLCYIMFDGDNPGIAAATNVAKKLCKYIDTKVVILPRNEDPKTLSKLLLQKALENARIIK